MTTDTDRPAQPRIPLSRDRVLQAAVRLADDSGIDAVTMRRLASELGVEAMSLYYHVASKEELFDGMVDMVVAEIEERCGGFSVPGDLDWKSALRKRILTARQVMLRHPWAPGVLETRTTMSPRMVLYFDTVLGIMVEGGFSFDLGHHAMHALGSRVLGFNQELFAPDSDTQEDQADEMLAQMAERVPYIVGMMQEIVHDGPEETLGWCDDQTEFEFSLDLLLDGLEQRLG
ncbi:MAG: TetR/AcrR family transcriptional regulator C-terminal domain-containing protein [Acidimicrobiia bacterium]|nr:TetR/AcrR family transcriptional regulator C-terminal domain-containing protein [Acidimicrobiia bacterium]